MHVCRRLSFTVVLLNHVAITQQPNRPRVSLGAYLHGSLAYSRPATGT